MLRSDLFDDVAASASVPPPVESPCLGSGEGGGLGSNKDGDAGVSEEGEAAIPGFNVKPAVGSGEKTKNSGPSIQETVEEKSDNASGQACSNRRVALKKYLRTP